MASHPAHFQYTQPLRLRGATPGNPHRGSIRKGHKPHLSITKGLKSLAIDNQPQTVPVPFLQETMSPVQSSPCISSSTSSVNSLAIDDFRLTRSPLSSTRSGSSFTPTGSWDSIDGTWDVVEDLPLRWASDYVSLAISGSRLANTSVLFYDIWTDPTTGGSKGALLAVATKSTILLYETPKGERAFRFVKVSHSVPTLLRFSGSRLPPPGAVSATIPRASHTCLYPTNVSGPDSCVSFLGVCPYLGILYPWSTSGDAIRISMRQRPDCKKRF